MFHMAQPDLFGSVAAGGEMQIGKGAEIGNALRWLKPCLRFLSSLRTELDSHAGLLASTKDDSRAWISRKPNHQ